jgi:hypothetical protein
MRRRDVGSSWQVPELRIGCKALAATRDFWLAGFAEMQSASLAALRHRVEARSGSRDVRKSKHKSKVKK